MNRFEQNSRKSYNKKADNYEMTFDGKFTEKFKRLLLKTISIPKDGTILDVACGNGRFLNQLQAQSDFHGIGVDIAENMVSNAKILNPHMEFKVSGCENMPFEDNTIDIITVCASFHHFPDVEKFSIESKRLLKHDGVIYIAEVYLPPVVRVICNPFVALSKAGDVKFYSPQEIISLFEAQGFTKDKVIIDGIVQVVAMRVK